MAVIGNGSECCPYRDYTVQSALGDPMEPFPRWFHEQIARHPEWATSETASPMVKAACPSRRVCSFRSMMSHGSHYRVEENQGDVAHVTFDCGVAEIRASGDGAEGTRPGGGVELVRVGTLKDILVLNYANLNVVLMVVSWVSKHTELNPRLRRDSHGFWLANLAATPRCTKDPYILPELASQVAPICTKPCPCVGLFSAYRAHSGQLQL